MHFNRELGNVNQYTIHLIEESEDWYAEEGKFVVYEGTNFRFYAHTLQEVFDYVSNPQRYPNECGSLLEYQIRQIEKSGITEEMYNYIKTKKVKSDLSINELKSIFAGRFGFEPSNKVIKDISIRLSTIGSHN